MVMSFDKSQKKRIYKKKFHYSRLFVNLYDLVNNVLDKIMIYDTINIVLINRISVHAAMVKVKVIP